MISRVAENCFWLGRYLERTEATARLLNVTRHLSMDAELEPRQCWLPVVIVIGEQPRIIDRTTEHPIGYTSGEQVERFMTWDDNNSSSIHQSVAALRENARTIREVISLEMWEAINELYLWLNSEHARSEYMHERAVFYRRIRDRCQLTAGLMRSTMLHDLPLNFIWLGMLLERGSQTARVVDVHHHAFTLHERSEDAVEAALWLSLLRACSGMEPFMKRHHGNVTGEAVATFLTFEGSFPKSIAYSVREARHRLEVIRPPLEVDLPGARSAQRLTSLDTWITSQATRAEDRGVHDQLTYVVDELAAICDLVGEELFGHAPVVDEDSPFSLSREFTT